MIFTRRTRPNEFGRAFTMVELVMVVAIITLLAGITIGVGVSMADSGRKRATSSVLSVLDQALDDYINATGSIPPALISITLQEDVGTNTRGQTVFYPAVDGTVEVVIMNADPDAPERHYVINSVGLFLESVEQAVDIDELLSSVDNKFVRNHDVPDDLQPNMLTVFDAWGNPIRFVHPKFDGILEDGRRALSDPGVYLDIFDLGRGFFTADALPIDQTLIPFDGLGIRRNRVLAADRVGFPGIEPDSDGGVCPGQRPYFYSAGPDGDPSTIADNVYTTLPGFIDPL